MDVWCASGAETGAETGQKGRNWGNDWGRKWGCQRSGVRGQGVRKCGRAKVRFGEFAIATSSDTYGGRRKKCEEACGARVGRYMLAINQ